MSQSLSDPWNFQVVAHRGFKAHYAENTLVSFEKALEVGATMVELDIRMTKDNRVVILHDTTLLRLGNYRRHVSTMTWEELEKINLYDKEARHLKSGSVLSLEKLFKALGKKVCYYIEIKASKRHKQAYKERLCRDAVALTERYGLKEQALFVTFDLPLLQYLSSYNEKLHLGLNFDKELLSKKQLSILKAMRGVLCPNEALLTEELLKQYQTQGFKVIPWVVNDNKRMKELIDWKVDGITTDFPDKLAALIQLLD